MTRDGGPRKGGGAFSQVRWGSMPSTWTNCHEATVPGVAKLSPSGCDGGSGSTANAALPQCFIITGEADFLMKIVCKDIPSYEALLFKTLSQIEEIERCKTLMTLSTVKDASILPYVYE